MLAAFTLPICFWAIDQAQSRNIPTDGNDPHGIALAIIMAIRENHRRGKKLGFEEEALRVVRLLNDSSREDWRRTLPDLIAFTEQLKLTPQGCPRPIFQLLVDQGLVELVSLPPSPSRPAVVAPPPAPVIERARYEEPKRRTMEDGVEVGDFVRHERQHCTGKITALDGQMVAVLVVDEHGNVTKERRRWRLRDLILVRAVQRSEDDDASADPQDDRDTEGVS